MTRQTVRRPFFGILFVCVIMGACDDSATLLNLNGLQRYLKLTPSQAEIISGHAQQIITEVETFIQVARQTRNELTKSQGRVDDRTVAIHPVVEEARIRAVARIHQIADEIRKELNDKQQKRFDRIVLPDLRRSPQELEFLMVQSRQDTFSALRVKPVANIERSADIITYDDLKEQRTIVFGPGGFSTGLEQFPIFVTATLYDSVLVNAEQQAIDSDHKTENQPEGTFIIRVIISTFLHESYTSLDRWVIIIQNDYGDLFEPVDIIEETKLSAPKPSPLVPRGYLGEGNIPLARKARQFKVYVPYRDTFGRPILDLGTQFLQLVLFEKDDPDYRTQGRWVFH